MREIGLDGSGLKLLSETGRQVLRDRRYEHAAVLFMLFPICAENFRRIITSN